MTELILLAELSRREGDATAAKAEMEALLEAKDEEVGEGGPHFTAKDEAVERLAHSTWCELELWIAGCRWQG
eukprot:scaffold6443_cov17-Tisochrysis_lutea.AAC.2